MKYGSIDVKSSKCVVVEETLVNLSLKCPSEIINYVKPFSLFKRFYPLLLFFINEIKIVSYSFSTSAIEYNSNEK